MSPSHLVFSDGFRFALLRLGSGLWATSSSLNTPRVPHGFPRGRGHSRTRRAGCDHVTPFPGLPSRIFDLSDQQANPHSPSPSPPHVPRAAHSQKCSARDISLSRPAPSFPSPHGACVSSGRRPSHLDHSGSFPRGAPGPFLVGFALFSTWELERDFSRMYQ